MISSVILVSLVILFLELCVCVCCNNYCLVYSLLKEFVFAGENKESLHADESAESSTHRGMFLCAVNSVSFAGFD